MIFQRLPTLLGVDASGRAAAKEHLVMRQNLSKAIGHCHANAGACARKAETAFTRDMREDFLQLEQNWVVLARGLLALRGWDIGALPISQFETALAGLSATESRPQGQRRQL